MPPHRSSLSQAPQLELLWESYHRIFWYMFKTEAKKQLPTRYVMFLISFPNIFGNKWYFRFFEFPWRLYVGQNCYHLSCFTKAKHSQRFASGIRIQNAGNSWKWKMLKKKILSAATKRPVLSTLKLGSTRPERWRLQQAWTSVEIQMARHRHIESGWPCDCTNKMDQFLPTWARHCQKSDLLVTHF